MGWRLVRTRWSVRTARRQPDQRGGRDRRAAGGERRGQKTLLRHGNGLLRSQRGAVRVLGQPVGRRPVAELAREVGLVMQQPAHMLFAPTVRAELAAGPRALRRHDPAWCDQLSARFGLEPLLDRPPQMLSAGEQRRVAIAAVLAPGPGRCCWTSRPPARMPTPAPRCAACWPTAPLKDWRSRWRLTIPAGPGRSATVGSAGRGAHHRRCRRRDGIDPVRTMPPRPGGGSGGGRLMGDLSPSPPALPHRGEGVNGVTIRAPSWPFICWAAG